MLDCGLRIEEALELTRDKIDMDNLLIKVRGKGEKHRIVPVSLELRRVLHRWLGRHRHAWVFPTMQGRRLHQRNTLRDLKLIGRRLKVTGVRVSFHTFRHTFRGELSSGRWEPLLPLKDLGPQQRHDNGKVPAKPRCRRSASRT